MRLWTIGLATVLAVALLATAPKFISQPSPEPAGRLIRVDNGTSVTIWEQTGTIDELTYSVATLMGPGGTHDTAGLEHYTFTSDGVSVKIHCYVPKYENGSLSGNNIAAVRLNGVAGYPNGIWASTIVSYIVGYGGVESSRFYALGDDIVTHTWMGDQDSELVLGLTVDEPTNHAPSIASFSPVSLTEGGAAVLSVSATDPDGDPLRYRWDFDGDGAWDTGWSPDSTIAHTWGDDWSGTAEVMVTDGSLNVTAQTSVNVSNMSPVVTNLTIVPATPGCNDTEDEHGDHDGGLEHEDHGCGDRDDDGCHDDDRDEGCKDHDEEGGCRDGDKDGEHEGRDHDHDHDDDDQEGGTCGTTFVFWATAVDPGSDDLTFFWDFGDGTNTSHAYYNNGVSPDPYPSPGPTFPVNVTNETTHTYTTSGNFTVTLIVSDDDGGNVTVVQHVLVCAGGGDEHGDHDGEHEYDDCGERDAHDENGDHDGEGEDRTNGGGVVDALPGGPSSADSAGVASVVMAPRFLSEMRFWS